MGGLIMRNNLLVTSLRHRQSHAYAGSGRESKTPPEYSTRVQLLAMANSGEEHNTHHVPAIDRMNARRWA